MSFVISPLTPELWTAFEDLFGNQGACYGCWCTYFRLRPALRKVTDGEGKKKIIRQRIEAGPPPGLLAFEDGQAIGWMQIGPRADVPEWNNTGRVSAEFASNESADPAVWAISCFFLRKQARGRGVTHRMVEAGLAFAARNGARFVEACPMDNAGNSKSVGLFVGSSRVFEKAGFSRLVERKAGRPLMRYVL